jgi:hypothetical protein
MDQLDPLKEKELKEISMLKAQLERYKLFNGTKGIKKQKESSEINPGTISINNRIQSP